MFGPSGRRIFLLSLLVLTLYPGSQFVPAYVHAVQFDDFIKQEVQFAGFRRATPEDVREHIVEQSKDLDFSVEPSDVRILKRGAGFSVEFDDWIPVDPKVYRRDLTFHVSETGELFEQ